ncbi:hypothetical protein [Acinetobacter sp. ESBL14]|uniref:hypothetical protein n=1 Tax=Acinetobacter sp. ESBL14 TaxID=3077329 RepID=UPI002FCC567C
MSEQEQDQFETEELDTEPQEQEEHRDDGQPDTEKPESEEFFIGIEGEEPQQQEDEFHGQPAPKWVKETREENRANKKRIRELEAQLASQTKPHEIELGEKPTLDSVGYDTDEYERQVTDWYAKKAQFEQQEQAKKAEQEKAAQNWQERVNSYETKKTAIKAKVADYDVAEEIARDVLNQTQQGILIHGADNPELLIYHLGKHPEKAKELAGITDPIQFAFKVAKIDAQLKVQTRKPQTSPERKVQGSAPLSNVADAKEAELEKKALETGDRTELIKYRKSKGK